VALFGSSDKNKEGAKPAQPNFVNQGQGPQPPQQPAAQPPQPAHTPPPPQPPQSALAPQIASEAKTPPPSPPTSSAKPIPATLKDVEQSATATHAPAHAEPRSEALAPIGRGSKVSGKLHFEGTVRIEGTVEGELSAGDLLQIGDRAVVNAQPSGTVIVIRGRVTGDVSARKRVELRAPGKLYGNVTTPSLVIDDGVTFEGYCSMGAEPKAAPSPPPK